MGRTIRGGFAVLMVAVLVGACGGDDDRQAPAATTTTTGAAPTTTADPACSMILADAIRLGLEYRQEVRGVAGADEAKYRARAQELVTRAEPIGCPVRPAVEQFLQ